MSSAEEIIQLTSGVMEWGWGKDILLGAVALYGAVLSTLNWQQSRKKEERLIRVNSSHTVALDGSREFRVVEAVNVGHRRVTIVFVGLELPGVCQFVLQGEGSATEIPCVLEDGDSVVAKDSNRNIAKFLMRLQRAEECDLVPIAYDSVGRTYRGAAFRFEPKGHAAALL